VLKGDSCDVLGAVRKERERESPEEKYEVGGEVVELVVYDDDDRRKRSAPGIVVPSRDVLRSFGGLEWVRGSPDDLARVHKAPASLRIS
jgi:hypothetical protein